MELKKCIYCLVEKEFSEFTKDTRIVDGIKNKCKQCVKEKRTKEIPIGIKKCRACEQEKEYTNFHRDKKNLDGFCNRCSSCYDNKTPVIAIDKTVGESKICEVCNIDKDLSCYNKRTKRSYTHEPVCKICKKEGLKIVDFIFVDDKRKCYTCKEYKTFDNFTKNENQSNGLASSCKSCLNAKKKEYRDSLPEDIKKERKRKEYEKNRQKYIDRAKSWGENNKERKNEWIRERFKIRNESDVLFKLKASVRALINVTFRRKSAVKNSKSFDILKCDIEQFRQHIESQFLSWMSWDNYGNCETKDFNCTWQLDHIIPLSYAKTEEDIHTLNHWSNFQPLCGKINGTKSDRDFPVCNIELKIKSENKQLTKI